ncbi:substrate-binding periplasmic protein [Sulfurimonas paralvinellae]|uniref:Amino acid ABC transporter substrate-binding protein n=1 Tax=Sulfurimonas paralvinellae TaxID=317658 RepID=A0A7M1B9Z2_9BACT|nr:transporter substrate-binding domain-containing protein [Sulfurimonas paralvinellae]QOP46451.1 amino acid ABC transporter substrate-binding protein [Sulfurimonas paralvinellae]
MKILHFLVAILLIFSSVKADSSKAFYWTDDEDYPPLIYRGADGKPTGILYDIMKEAFHRLDTPLKVDVYPWNRSQKMVKNGTSDGMVSLVTKERSLFTKASDPILLSSEYIFVNKNNPHLHEIMSVRSLKDLKPFKIVEALGAGWTQANLKGFKIEWVPNIGNAFEMLIKERADIYIANGYTATDFIEKKVRIGNTLSQGYKKIIMNPYPIKTVAFRLLINKNSTYVDILDKFNKVINQMKMDGTIDAIIAKRRSYSVNKTSIIEKENSIEYN